MSYMSCCVGERHQAWDGLNHGTEPKTDKKRNNRSTYITKKGKYSK